MEKDVHKICSWLEQRPEVQKAVILEGLQRRPDADDFEFYAVDVLKRLHGAKLPPEFGRWCLEQAVVREDMKPRVADYLFEKAFYWISNEDPALKSLREHAQNNERWKAILEKLLASRKQIEEQDLKHQELTKTFTEEQQQEEERWLAHVRSNEATLRENRAAPALLYQLARSYFGIDSTSSGTEAVEEALRGDQRLTQAVLQSFRDAVERMDIPAFEEILNVQAQGHMHYLALPFLAGLSEIERTCPEDTAQWDDNRVRKAIAFYLGYGTPLPGGQREWYQRLLVTRPETVAEVQVQIAVSEFRSGSERIGHFWELARDKDHGEVARHATLPLLRAFPIRCKLKQLRALDHLLWAAIEYADESLLRSVIESKLARTSTTVAQRVHWLAAGAIVSPGAYDDYLEDYVKGRENRIRHVADFFGSQGRVRVDLEIPLSERLVRLVGSHIGPEPLSVAGGLIRSEKTSSDFVNVLIQRLAVSSRKDASDALTLLLADPALVAWRVVLSHAQDTQRVIRRDAEFRHPTIEQVRQTLKDGTPANAGDLAALVMDRLGKIAGQISTNNANYWRPYWNEDPKTQKPTDPKHENSCRDALVHDLRLFFPNAEPEVQHVDNKRSDIRVAYENFHVPVEIKKNSHPDLWSALRSQLIEQYTNRAPETDGYGIYLVFWFGKEYTQAPPSGKRPGSAVELEERLKEETTLSPEESRKISVCVIDVSKP